MKVRMKEEAYIAVRDLAALETANQALREVHDPDEDLVNIIKTISRRVTEHYARLDVRE